MKRKIYLNKMSLANAQEKFFACFSDQLLPAEEISVQDARDRITAEPVYAHRSAPHYAASAMDGIAVKAGDTILASERTPVILHEGINAFWLDTGDPIPEGYNAVIKVEEINRVGEKELSIEKSAAPWQHIRSIGESVIRGQLVLPVNHEITAYDIGGLLEAGITRIKVRRKPQVGIIPTGTELVPPDVTPVRGQLIEFNSRIIRAMGEEWGGDYHVTEIIPDDFERIKATLSAEIAKNDLTITIAGSSAGEEDFTVKILQELGEVLVHGVNIMPGKPIILAKVQGKPVIGLPGYPLATTLNHYLFVRPLIYLLTGRTVPATPVLEAVIKRKIPSDVGLQEFLRVNLAEINGEMVAVPRKKGAAAMESLLNADAVLAIPEQSEGLQAGSRSPVYILKPERELRKNLLMIGSHDLALDLLRNELGAQRAGFDLLIQAVGSMAGLMALKRGECHLAGAHLLDEATGEYNYSFVRQVLGEKKMAMFNLVYRQQGLMVPKGNPKRIETIADLRREDVTFINRQRGAGTRILLDVWLKKLGILPEEIAGYEREEYTHIAAAVAVATGSADTALGIMAAAQAMDLDFVPLEEERYDLVLPLEMLNDWRIQTILEIIRTETFKATVQTLGGYRTDETGIILLQGEDSSNE